MKKFFNQLKTNNYLNTIFDSIILIFISSYFSYFKFKDFFKSGGNKVIGDNGDPRLILFLQEHIYQSLNSNIFKLTSPPVFYPYKWTITFSDWVIFPGFFHSFFRFIGHDLFASFEYSMILSNALFFIFLYIAIRSITKLNKIFSIFISVLISYGYFLDYHNYWLQNFSIFLIPLFFYFLISKDINILNLRKLNNFLNKNNYLISGIIIMFTLFSSFYFGVSLLIFSIIYFIVQLTLNYKKDYPLKNFLIKNFISKKFISLFSFSFIFILLNIPALFIADVAGFSEKNLGFGRVQTYYLYPFSLIVFFGWLDFFIKKFFFKNKIKILRIEKSFLLVTTTLLIIFFQFIPDIWNISNDYNYLSINQIFINLNGSIIRDYTRFFYVYYLFSIIYACFLLKSYSQNFSLFFSRIKIKKLKNIYPLLLLILLGYIYKFDLNLPKKTYIHNLDVDIHKTMLNDAEKQLAEQKNCKLFYLESYDRNLQINQLSAGLIAITSNIPTINGYSGATPKGWLSDKSGFMNQKYKEDLNKYFDKKNLDRNTICKVEYRTPPFGDLIINNNIIKFIYNNNTVKFIFSDKEKNGNYYLLKDQFGAYYVKEKSTDNQPFLIRSRDKVVGLHEDLPYTILEVENIRGVNQILSYDHSIGGFQLWEADEKWHLKKIIQDIKFDSEKLNLVNKNFNSNYSINFNILDKNGEQYLLKDNFGTYYVQQKEDKLKLNPILRNSKLVGFDKEFKAYNLVSAEIIDGINQVVDYSKWNKTVYVWMTDSNWNFIKDLKIVNEKDNDFLKLEYDHKIDINNDGFIGSIINN